MRTKALFICTAAIALATSVQNISRADKPIPEEYKTNGFFLGCQAWTWNHFSVFEAIEKTAASGGKVIEFYPGQRLSPEEPNTPWDHNASPETVEKVKAQLVK